MPSRDPRLDFADDGGTPMWRRRQTVVIDVAPRGLRGLWARWNSQPFLAQAIQIAFVFGIMPFVIIFGGLILIGIWDAIFGG